MTREQVEREVMASTGHSLLLEFPTGYGKSKMALELMLSRFGNYNLYNRKVLIAVPKLCLKDNWKDEIRKWCSADADILIDRVITFTTYVSLPKHAGTWDMCIFDECHHLSERCREALLSFASENNILLSATVKRTIKWDLKKAFPGLEQYNIPTRDAIESEVLPDPRVILIPLKLNNTEHTETIVDKKRGKSMTCTQAYYYNHISRMIEWYKNKSMGGSMALKNIWLHKAGDRLKWLSEKKTPVVKEILKKLKSRRTLTFCSSIAQTEELGRNHIHSKNKGSEDILQKFNEGKIKHITSVAMLDEGVNLADCQIGIYANLNSSERIVKQRLGRILRHRKPVIIIPFFLGTRDEEIVRQMITDYNKDLISVVYHIKDIKI